LSFFFVFIAFVVFCRVIAIGRTRRLDAIPHSLHPVVSHSLHPAVSHSLHPVVSRAVYAEDDTEYLAQWLAAKLLRGRYEHVRHPANNDSNNNGNLNRNGTSHSSRSSRLSLYTAEVTQQTAREENRIEVEGEEEFGGDDLEHESDSENDEYEFEEDDIFGAVRHQATVPLHVVVKVIAESGLASPDLADEMKGTHALIFLLPWRER
jgi:hypothetical protein